jgi:ABC-type sugar transport system ATPase subunit
VLVMRRGAAEGELSRAEATEEHIMRLAVSGAQNQAEAA